MRYGHSNEKGWRSSNSGTAKIIDSFQRHHQKKIIKWPSWDEKRKFFSPFCLAKPFYLFHVPQALYHIAWHQKCPTKWQQKKESHYMSPTDLGFFFRHASKMNYSHWKSKRNCCLRSWKRVQKYQAQKKRMYATFFLPFVVWVDLWLSRNHGKKGFPYHGKKCVAQKSNMAIFGKRKKVIWPSSSVRISSRAA